MALPVVGIGASAGGLEALELFISQIEPNSGIAYVVVTHQAAGRPTLLPELLARHARVEVVHAENGMKLMPNRIYVSPPGRCLSVTNERLCVTEGEEAERRLPIDHLFRSMARSDGDRAIAIVLSGTGTDGALGVAEIKGASGMVMAQDPETAKYDGMPRSAIATHTVDYVLPPGRMPDQLARYVKNRRPHIPDAAEDEADGGRDALNHVFFLLRRRTGNDFTAYKKSTVRRRVERRMSVHDIASVEDYAAFLEKTPYEIDVLLKELLISVTSFFRDPDAFVALGAALERAFELKEDTSPFRAWVAGCCTGEEAYSIAILAEEVRHRMGKQFGVQIFATDLDAAAVDVARAGRYSEGIAADVSPDRLARYFLKEDNAYFIKREIRELVIFAVQNVIKDPPFTKLDLLACRNLLIYLEPELQKRVLALFGYSLHPEGILFLGSSESVSGFEGTFTNIDRKWKLFRRRGPALHRLPDFPAELPHVVTGRRQPGESRAGARAPGAIAPLAERLLMASYVPPSAVVTANGELIYIHGRVGPFLEPAPGEPSTNVFHMAREGLRLELPAAVRQAAKQTMPVIRDGVQVKTNGGYTSIRLTARKISEPEGLQGAFMITFEPEQPRTPASKKGAIARGESKSSEQLKGLEQELLRAKENLQGTIEELETSNEELKSTNEELQSTNEELQSANEELETSREEMQSLNEELQTVNAEFEERNRSLSQANDDMQNLLNSTEIATVFLDEKLAIKRFTTEARKVFRLIDTDVGRPIADLTANLRFDAIVEDAEEVLRTLVFREREVQTKTGAWRLMRITPYRTHDNLIDGLVMTFVDIDRVKRAEEKIQEARTYAETIAESVREALLVLDSKLMIVSANRAFCDLFQTTRRRVEGEPLEHVADGTWANPDLMNQLKRVLESNEVISSFDFSRDFPRVGQKHLRLSARRMQAGPEKPGLVLLTIAEAN